MKQFLFVFLVAGSLVACKASANPEHGKEGHKCDKECMASQESKTGAATSETVDLKDHVCTDACKDGNHVYTHGEKGHVCTEACKNEKTN